MATTDIDRLAVLIEANTKSYENAMKRLQSQTEKALRASGKSVDSLNARLNSITSTLTKVAGAFGIVLGGRAVLGAITNAIKSGEAIGDTAQQIGISAEALQEFNYVADLTGTSQEGLQAAFKGMTKALGEAQRGSKEAQAEFANLGVTFADIKGKDPSQIFEMLLDRIGKISDPLRRNAELMKIFGKSGLEMANMAQLGAAGIDELRQKARDLGIVLSNEVIKKAQDGGDILDTLSHVFSTAGTSLAVEFLPALRAFARLVTDPNFQSSVGTLARAIGDIVGFVEAHPVLMKIAAGGAIGARFGGGIGAAIGVGTVALGEGMSATLGNPWASTHHVLDAGTISNPGGTLMGRGGATGTVRVADADDGWKASDADEVKKRIEDVTKALQLQLAQLTMNDREVAIANELARAQVSANSEAGGAIAALAAKLYDQRHALEAANEAAGFFGDTLYDAIDGLILKGDSFNDVLKNIISSLAEAALKATLLGQGPLAGLFGAAPAQSGGVGGLLGGVLSAAKGLFGGMFADGGTLGAGKWGIAGENGPELIRGPANVTPLRGGDQAITINVNVSGARGNREIQTMVAQGVQAGIGAYDKMKNRLQLTAA